MMVYNSSKESIENAKKRIFRSMIDAGKSVETMARVMHVNAEELDKMLMEEGKAREKKGRVDDSILREWDDIHEKYLKYRRKNPLNR